MNLHEYQAKQLLSQYGLPIPKGCICSNVNELEDIIFKVSNQGPWVMKCQVHTGGRGKSGGVQIAEKKEDVDSFVKYWLGRRLVTYQTDSNGKPVNHILIEEFTNIIQELYVGVIIDRSSCLVTFLVSIEGGTEIEKTAEKKSNLLYKVNIDPLIGPMPYQSRELAFKIGLNDKLVSQFTKIFMGLVTIFIENDLSMIEINPLAVTSEGNLVCLDAKLIVDKNALFRHPNLDKMYDKLQEDYREMQAAELNLNYVALDGNIGCMVNGAGLAMCTMDIIKLCGGKPANFLDVGGGVTIDRVTEAFKIIVSDDKVKIILVNIFGGIVRCDLIADGIIHAMKKEQINIPIIVRLEGNNAELGEKKLIDSCLDIILEKNLVCAAKKAVSIVEKKNVYFNR